MYINVHNSMSLRLIAKGVDHIVQLTHATFEYSLVERATVCFSPLYHISGNYSKIVLENTTLSWSAYKRLKINYVLGACCVTIIESRLGL